MRFFSARHSSTPLNRYAPLACCSASASKSTRLQAKSWTPVQSFRFRPGSTAHSATVPTVDIINEVWHAGSLSEAISRVCTVLSCQVTTGSHERDQVNGDMDGLTKLVKQFNDAELDPRTGLFCVCA